MSRMKRIGRLGLLLAWAWLAGRYAHAANPDTIVLSVTPGNFTYGVQISSPEAGGYDFASVNFGATTVSTVAIVVNNAGNVPEYFSIAVSNTGPDGWTAIPTGTPGFNQFQMSARVQSSGSTKPSPSNFDVNADTVTASIPSVAAGRYGQSVQTNPGVNKDLWLRLTMPQSASSAATQTMTITVNGQSN